MKYIVLNEKDAATIYTVLGKAQKILEEAGAAQPLVKKPKAKTEIKVVEKKDKKKLPWEEKTKPVPSSDDGELI